MAAVYRITKRLNRLFLVQDFFVRRHVSNQLIDQQDSLFYMALCFGPCMLARGDFGFPRDLVIDTEEKLRL